MAHTSSVVVKYLRDRFVDKSVVIVVMYCNHREQAKQRVRELIASLLKQVIQDQPQISHNIKFFYENHKVRGTSPTSEELRKAFQSEIGTSRVFVVVDALDECLERDQENLIRELQLLATTIHLMVTSRPLPLIKQIFQGAAHLEIRATDDDVRKYIEDRILRERRLALHVDKDQTLQECIVNKVIANVQGMYVFLKSVLVLQMGA